MSSTGTQHQSDRARWFAFAAAVAAAALTILDLTKVNVALPSITDTLQASSTQQQLIVAGYTLAFGLVLIPAGRIGDMTSRRRVFLIGLLGFGAASLACGFAATAEALITFRLIQGVTAGMLMPQMMGMMQSMFPSPRERGRVFGMFGGIIGLSTAFGPTLGGFLIAIAGPEDGWRWGFWMNVPLAIVLAYLASHWLPRYQERGPKQSLDLVGLLLVGVAVLSLMLPFVLTTGSETDDPRRFVWLLVFAVFATAFVLWERRYQASGKVPAVNLTLLRTPSYRYGILVGTCYFAANPATFLIVALFLQRGLGIEPVFAGMVTIPFALASAVTAVIGGRLVAVHGRRVVIAGLVIVMIGMSLLLVAAFLAPVALAPWLMAGAFLIGGIGGGFVISPNQTLTLSTVPPSQGGVAGSVVQVAQRTGNAIGVAAVTTAFYATMYREVDGVPIDVYHDAFRNAMIVVLGLYLLALVFALLDRESRLPETGAIRIPNPPPAVTT